MLTIETGITITKANEISKYKDIIRSHKVSHLQLSGIPLDDFSNTVEFILSNFDTNLELSYKMDINEAIRLYNRSSTEGLFIKEPKYLVIPLEILTSLERASISSFVFFEKITELMRSRFVCIEVLVANQNLGDISTSISSLKNIKEAHPSTTILYSLKMDSLDYLPKIKTHMKEIRNFIGLVQVNVDKNQLNKNNKDSHFIELVDLLYWLPYKQQPLIFSNSLLDIEDVLIKFDTIVNDRGYTYF